MLFYRHTHTHTHYIKENADKPRNGFILTKIFQLSIIPQENSPKSSVMETALVPSSLRRIRRSSTLMFLHDSSRASQATTTLLLSYSPIFCFSSDVVSEDMVITQMLSSHLWSTKNQLSFHELHLDTSRIS
ncbi:hypothetical protein CDL12_00377 [Handroanthus impetiginosus]|uniref:Uncharacterized protein n=1 Tax=Handroanthus impetiginosus TaxID=429701 RepID=A0A2G9IAW0_9LAMI|nr:hypothetical protein CDL12_00377 [Handroanthus impetiginosus]